MTVERVCVGDVLHLDRVPIEPDPAIEYVSIGVRSFGKGIFHYEPKLGGQLGRLRFFEVRPNHLVVSNIKGWEGAIAVSSESDAGCVASNRFLSYVPIEELIDVRWARWYFLSESGIELIRRASPGSADRNRTLAIDRFEALEIPLPPIEEQRRVATRLDKLNAAVSELTNRTNRVSELTKAFVVSASSRPDLDEEAKARAGWRHVLLAEVLELSNREIEVEGDATYEIAGVYSFGRGLFTRRALEGTQTSYKALHRLKAGQLVLSRLKAWEGALAIVPTELEGWFVSPEFPTFDVDTEQVEAPFLGVVLTSERFWSRLKGASHGIGARRERVSAAKLLEQVVELPPIEEQRSVVGTIKLLHASRVHRQRAEQQIGSLVPAAMNQAFAGLG